MYSSPLNRKALVYVLGFFLIASPADAIDSDPTNYYSQGLELKSKGNWTEALQIWIKGQKELAALGKCDPRLGIAFLDVVTKHKEKKYYAAASAMYFWGLSHFEKGKHKKDIENEMKRIEPLLEKEEYKKWRSLFKKNDPRLWSEISGFWVKNDPTPTTPFNERLIEHWNRIQFARENYTENQRSPYGTDDRGTIYVRYGKPNRMRAGNFGIDTIELTKWIDDPAGRVMFMEYLDGPEYEIWLYTTLDDDDPVIYYFGRREGTGGYGLRTGIEDFIPKRAFRANNQIEADRDRSRRDRAEQAVAGSVIQQGQGSNGVQQVLINSALARNQQGFLPGSILQMMYYGQLVALDETFNKRYMEIESLWTQSFGEGVFPTVSASQSLRQKNRTRDISDPVKAFAPKEQSSYDAVVPAFKIEYNNIRVLDEDDTPVVAVIASSAPDPRDEKIYYEFLQQIALPDYDLKHTLIIRDDKWMELDRIDDTPSDRMTNLTTFFVKQTEPDLHYTFVAEKFENNSRLTNLGELPLSTEAVAIGKSVLEVKEPLSGDMQKLELSDVVAGLLFPGESDASGFPFPVIPAKTISNQDTLQIYLEVYHLFFDANQQASFSIDFQLKKPGKRSLLNLIGRGRAKNVLSMSSNFSSVTSTAREIVAFNISDVQAGEYELNIEVKDNVSNQKKTRMVPLTIVK